MYKKRERTRFSRYAEGLRRLTRQHLELKDEPMRLALAYEPRRDPNDVFLFEVVENFGANAPSPDKDLFEVTYGGSEGFPLPKSSELHLVLTNPTELRMALREHWPLAEEVRKAVSQGKFLLFHSDDVGKQLLELFDA